MTDLVDRPAKVPGARMRGFTNTLAAVAAAARAAPPWGRLVGAGAGAGVEIGVRIIAGVGAGARVGVEASDGAQSRGDGLHDSLCALYPGLAAYAGTVPGTERNGLRIRPRGHGRR